MEQKVNQILNALSIIILEFKYVLRTFKRHFSNTLSIIILEFK